MNQVLVGGTKSLWLFADLLQPGKKYYGEVSGYDVHKGRNGEVPYVVWVGALDDGIAGEYKISTWRIRSAAQFDPTKAQAFNISKDAQGNIVFEKV